MKKMNSFLIRLFCTMIILFIVVILDATDKISYQKIKNFISEDINILRVIKNINGQSKYLKLVDLPGIDDICVSSEIVRKEEIKNGYRYYPTSMSGITSTVSAVVTSLQYDGEYQVTLVDSNNHKWVYSHLNSFNYLIYSYIKAGEIIGDCDTYYDLVIIKGNIDG